MRKHYLDNLRWVTVLLVVIYHVIYMYNGILPEGVIGPFHPVQYQDAIQYLLYPWFMVLLFVVAGASARYALQKQTPKQFLAARTKKLLVPSTIGLFVFHWCTGYLNMNVAGAFHEMSESVPGFLLYPIMVISGTGVLWFIQILWLYSLLLILIQKLEKGKLYARTENCSIPVLILLAIPLWLAAQFLNTPIIVVYRFGIYAMAFFLGYFVFSHDRITERLSRMWLPLTAAAVLLGIGYTAYYFGQNYASKPVVNSPFSIGFCWIAVLAAFSLAKKFGDKTGAFATWMGKYSFGLYVFHYTALSAAAFWICKGNNLSALPSYLITGLAAFLGSWILYEIISRIPLVRWCVLGISKKDNKHVS